MMKKIVLIAVALLASVVLISFMGSNELKPSELIHWVENQENGLTQSKAINEFIFEAQYKPVDYVVSLEARKDDVTENEYQQLKSELDGLQYIDLTIGTNAGQGNALSGGIQNEDEYYQRLDYFVTYANQDIYLIQGQDTLWPQLYHFERNYGLAPSNTLLLGFEKGNSEEDRNLIIDDQVLGVGRVKFLFEKENINSTPNLKTI